MTFILDFNLTKEQIDFHCSSEVNFKNGSSTGLKKVNWRSLDGNLSYFLLENAFELEDLNLNEGDSLYIYIFCNEANNTKLKNKRFYLSYMTYFLNSNNQLEQKLIIDKFYNLENEIALSLKNEAYLIYQYKRESNIINNGTKSQNFSSITPYGNARILFNEKASILPGFIIQIEETKELRILEVVAEITSKKLFFMMLGSISFIINIFVVICCLFNNCPCIKRVHSSKIEASNRDNLPNNEFQNNNNGIIDELNNQNA